MPNWIRLMGGRIMIIDGIQPTICVYSLILEVVMISTIQNAMMSISWKSSFSWKWDGHVNFARLSSVFYIFHKTYLESFSLCGLIRIYFGMKYIEHYTRVHQRILHQNEFTKNSFYLDYFAQDLSSVGWSQLKFGQH